MGKSTRCGFTLIELLVVISIIALLVGILLPVLGSARAAARQAQCLTQVRSIYLGSAAYAADEDGYFPAGGRAGYAPNGNRNLARLPAGVNNAGEFVGFGNGLPGNAIGLGPTLESGGYMPGQGETWLCPDAEESLAALGNTYMFRASYGPKWLESGASDSQKATDVYHRRYEDIEVALRPARIWWVSGNYQTLFPNAIQESAVDLALPADPASPLYDAVLAQLATIGFERSEPHPNGQYTGLSAQNASFFDGSAALRGSIPDIQ
ncbi:MAG: prepilin-type N-terminal cleavage/methylation domain-containing protein [Planctomycetota bacterium]